MNVILKLLLDSKYNDGLSPDYSKDTMSELIERMTPAEFAVLCDRLKIAGDIQTVIDKSQAWKLELGPVISKMMGNSEAQETPTLKGGVAQYANEHFGPMMERELENCVPGEGCEAR